MRVILFFVFAVSLWAQQFRVLVQGGAPMKTRDGVVLVADIYRPEAEGKFPVLLDRKSVV